MGPALPPICFSQAFCFQRVCPTVVWAVLSLCLRMERPQGVAVGGSSRSSSGSSTPPARGRSPIAGSYTATTPRSATARPPLTPRTATPTGGASRRNDYTVAYDLGDDDDDDDGARRRAAAPDPIRDDPTLNFYVTFPGFDQTDRPYQPRSLGAEVRAGVLAFLGVLFLVAAGSSGYATLASSWTYVTAPKVLIGQLVNYRAFSRSTSSSSTSLSISLGSPLLSEVELMNGISRYCVQGVCFAKTDYVYESESSCGRGAYEVKTIYDVAFYFIAIAMFACGLCGLCCLWVAIEFAAARRALDDIKANWRVGRSRLFTKRFTFVYCGTTAAGGRNQLLTTPMRPQRDGDGAAPFASPASCAWFPFVERMTHLTQRRQCGRHWSIAGDDEDDDDVPTAGPTTAAGDDTRFDTTMHLDSQELDRVIVLGYNFIPPVGTARGTGGRTPIVVAGSPAALTRRGGGGGSPRPVMSLRTAVPPNPRALLGRLLDIDETHYRMLLLLILGGIGGLCFIAGYIPFTFLQMSFLHCGVSVCDLLQGRVTALRTAVEELEAQELKTSVASSASASFANSSSTLRRVTSADIRGTCGFSHSFGAATVSLVLASLAAATLAHLFWLMRSKADELTADEEHDQGLDDEWLQRYDNFGPAALGILPLEPQQGEALSSAAVGAGEAAVVRIPPGDCGQDSLVVAPRGTTVNAARNVAFTSSSAVSLSTSGGTAHSPGLPVPHHRDLPVPGWAMLRGVVLDRVATEEWLGRIDVSNDWQREEAAIVFQRKFFRRSEHLVRLHLFWLETDVEPAFSLSHEELLRRRHGTQIERLNFDCLVRTFMRGLVELAGGSPSRATGAIVVDSDSSPQEGKSAVGDADDRTPKAQSTLFRLPANFYHVSGAIDWTPVQLSEHTDDSRRAHRDGKDDDDDDDVSVSSASTDEDDDNADRRGGGGAPPSGESRPPTKAPVTAGHHRLTSPPRFTPSAGGTGGGQLFTPPPVGVRGSAHGGVGLSPSDVAAAARTPLIRDVELLLDLAGGQQPYLRSSPTRAPATLDVDDDVSASYRPERPRYSLPAGGPSGMPDLHGAGVDMSPPMHVGDSHDFLPTPASQRFHHPPPTNFEEIRRQVDEELERQRAECLQRNVIQAAEAIAAQRRSSRHAQERRERAADDVAREAELSSSNHRLPRAGGSGFDDDAAQQPQVDSGPLVEEDSYALPYRPSYAPRVGPPRRDLLAHVVGPSRLTDVSSISNASSVTSAASPSVAHYAPPPQHGLDRSTGATSAGNAADTSARTTTASQHSAHQKGSLESGGATASWGADAVCRRIESLRQLRSSSNPPSLTTLSVPRQPPRPLSSAVGGTAVL